MRNPKFAPAGRADGSSWSLASELPGVNDSTGWAAKPDLDVHEVLERATELTLVDWLELADLLAGHF
jgi:hypothetical protein